MEGWLSTQTINAYAGPASSQPQENIGRVEVMQDLIYFQLPFLQNLALTLTASTYQDLKLSPQ
jgi:hypothetical protein